MASNYTEHYKLNQWELSDSVVMAEFNADNAKIEQALLNLKASFPKIQTGSYVGNDTYGAAHPNSLTFDFEPKLVLLIPEKKVTASPNVAVCIRNAPTTSILCTGVSNNTFSPALLHLTWEGNTLSWYSNNIGAQYNYENNTYHYFAIG